MPLAKACDLIVAMPLLCELFSNILQYLRGWRKPAIGKLVEVPNKRFFLFAGELLARIGVGFLNRRRRADKTPSQRRRFEFPFPSSRSVNLYDLGVF
jgi:hypothetical protein